MAAPKKAKVKVLEEPGVLFIRNVPPDVIAGLDAWVEQLRASTPGGGGITRTDLVRDLLAKAVREHEKSAR